MKGKILIIPCETQAREFDAKLLLACFAAERGFTVITGSKKEINKRVGSMPRSIFVSKSLTGRNVLMYELLTKKRLFTAPSERELLMKHMKEAPPSMRRYVPTIAPELDTFVRKLLAKRREDRPQDMTAVLYELSKWDKKATVHRLRQVKAVATTA